MTINDAKTIFLNRGYINGIFNGDKWRESVVVISKWLEQEPCKDCISREDTLNTMRILMGNARIGKEDDDYETLDDIKEQYLEIVKGMIGVQPMIPKGHWIDGKNGPYCDKCGNGLNIHYKFCPFCGADMREEHRKNYNLFLTKQMAKTESRK